MDEVKRTSFVVLLAGLMGFMLGAAVFGYTALLIGISFLGHAQGGIHTDRTGLVFIGTLVCLGLGGVAGRKGAVHLAKSWHDRTT